MRPESPTTKLYKPTSKTEAKQFFSKYCDRCVRDKPPNDCQILVKALLCEPTPEWHYALSGPTCSSFDDDRASCQPLTIEKQ